MPQSATPTDKPVARRLAHEVLVLTLILLTLALALPAGASAFVSSGGGWFARTSGTTTYLEDVACSDATHGWAVGMDGTILATSDGGATWSAQYSGTTESLFAVACGGAKHGWAVGWGGTILSAINVPSSTLSPTPTRTPTPTPRATPTPTLTLELSGLTDGATELGRSVTATGEVTPTSLIGSRVTLSVQQKQGAARVKVKSASASSRPKGKYAWTYTPAEKAAYRMQATIPATDAHAAAATEGLTFTVK